MSDLMQAIVALLIFVPLTLICIFVIPAVFALIEASNLRKHKYAGATAGWKRPCVNLQEILSETKLNLEHYEPICEVTIEDFIDFTHPEIAYFLYLQLLYGEEYALLHT